MKSNITILICLIVLTISCANKPELTWQEIHQQTRDESFFITVDDAKERDTMIIYLRTQYFGEETENAKLNKLLADFEDRLFTEDFDPLLSLLYIYNLYYVDSVKGNKKLYELLLKFNEYDSTNSIPSYMLSYYYLLNKDKENTIKYLREGNKKGNINLYNRELNDLIVKYYLDKTSNKIFSYSQSQYSQFYLLGIFSDYMQLVISEKNLTTHGNKDFKTVISNKDLIELGALIENSTDNGLDYSMGIAIQLRSIEDKKKIKELRNNRIKRHIIGAKSIGVNQMTDEDKLLEFLKDRHYKGEMYAFDKLLNIDPQVMEKEIELFCEDWFTNHIDLSHGIVSEKDSTFYNLFLRSMECSEN